MTSVYSRILSLFLVLIPFQFSWAVLDRSGNSNEYKDSRAKCLLDYELKVPGNFTSIRSFPVRVTGSSMPARTAAKENDKSCEMDASWLRNITEILKKGEHKDNVLIYIVCDSPKFPETRVQFKYDPVVNIRASTALNMVNCGTSWTDVSVLGRMVSLKVLEFQNPLFRKMANEQTDLLEKLFKNVSNIVLDPMNPATRDSLNFLEDFKFPKLHELDIEGPPADHLAWRTNSSDLLPNIQYLRLINANLTRLPKVQFSKMHKTWSPLETGLNTNKVAFEKMINPDLIDSHTDMADWLRKVEFQFSVDRTKIMKTLDLRGNQIDSLQEIPAHSNIEVLNIRQNKLVTMDQTVVRNLTGLSILDMGQNDFTVFDRNTFKDFTIPGLEMLHIDSTAINVTDTLNWVYLNKLKYLDISNCSVHVIAPMLRKLPSLKMLITRHNNLTAVTLPKEFDTVLYLHAGNNQVVDFPNWIFGSLSLEYVNLEHNRLTSRDVRLVAQSVFQQSLTSSTKRVVNLKNNCIRFLPVNGSEQATKLTNLLGQFFIDLSGNPMHCGCEDYKDYLRDQGVENVESIGCTHSTSLPDFCRQVYIDEYGHNSSDEYFLIDDGQAEPYACLSEKRKLFVIKLSVTVILIVIVLILLFYGLFSNRYDIQLALFYRYGIRLVLRGDKHVKNAKYDAFIAYSSKDYKWVVHTLYQELERGGYRLYIHDKDFVPGREITDNIYEGLNKSKRMIIVVSEYFLQSEWCTFEFRAAHKEEIVRGSNYLIAIVLQDIPKHKLPQDIRRYLSTKTYLDINDNWFWRKLAFALPAGPDNKPDVNAMTADALAARRRARLQARRQDDGRLLEVPAIGSSQEDQSGTFDISEGAALV